MRKKQFIPFKGAFKGFSDLFGEVFRRSVASLHFTFFQFCRLPSTNAHMCATPIYSALILNLYLTVRSLLVLFIFICWGCLFRFLQFVMFYTFYCFSSTRKIASASPPWVRRHSCEFLRSLFSLLAELLQIANNKNTINYSPNFLNFYGK